MAKQPESKEEPLAEEPSAACEFRPPDASQDSNPDPFAGQGGTYELNLLTGERRLISQPEEA